jgi:lysyl-tRNA synthetase class 2
LGDTTTTVATATSAAAGIGLVLLSAGLRRRQQVAWTASVLLASAATLLHLLKGLDVLEATTTAAVAILLLLTRSQFHAPTDRQRRRLILPTMLGLLATDVLLGLLLLARSGDVSASTSGSDLATWYSV